MKVLVSFVNQEWEEGYFCFDIPELDIDPKSCVSRPIYANDLVLSSACEITNRKTLFINPQYHYLGLNT